jgi:methyl-accepting chemotaxis protein
MVASSAKEQESSMIQINSTVNQLDTMTQKNASIASTISSMATSTSTLTKNLQSAVDRTEYCEESAEVVCDTELMFDMTKLKADHINFKNTNFAKCADGSTFRVTDHHSCNLGKWIDANDNNPDFCNSEYWEPLKEAHQNVHMSTQDVVNLYADDYANGQIFAVTAAVEDNIDKVFDYLDKVQSHNCSVKFDN